MKPKLLGYVIYKECMNVDKSLPGPKSYVD